MGQFYVSGGRTGTASWSLVLVFLSSSVVVSVATTAATTADYPDHKVTLPPAATGRPVRTQAIQGSPRVRGAWG